MGLLDGNPYGGGLLDPNTASLLGFAAGIGQASGPSRLPISLGQAFSGGIQGMLAGQQSAQLAQLRQAELTGQQIKNANDVLNYNLWAPYLGQQPISVNGPGGIGTPSISAPSPSQSPSPETSPQVASNGGGLLSGGSSPAATGDMMSLLSNTPPPLLARMGIQAPPELMAAYYAGVKPGTPEYQTLMRDVALNKAGVKPVIGGERPGVPAQNYDLSTGTYVPQPGSYERIYQGALSQAAGSGAGGLGAKEAESAFNAGLKVRTENEIERRKAFYQTGVVPPDFGSPTSQPIVSPDGDIATPRGTVIPAAPKTTTFPGADAILKQNITTQKTEENFGAIRGTLEGTESRLLGLAKALQTVQSGGLNEKRAEIANNLRGLGLNKAADAVLSGKGTAAVQTAMGLQTLDVLGQLKQINQGAGGRILNAEFTNLLEKQYGPNLSPQANYDLITQALGGVYQTRNMIDDYYKFGKPSGWRDANAFQSSYYSQPSNSYQTMVDRAGKTIGPLKGMEGGPGSPPQIDADAARAELRRRGVIQ